MVGKRVTFDDETWAAINLLRQERRRSFPQLAAEAFADLLEKHGRPVSLKEQLKASVPKPERATTKRAAKSTALKT